MSTSGTQNFNLVANEVIRSAFEVLGIAAEGEAVSADMYRRGKTALNLMIKSWGAQEHLWLKTERSLMMVGAVPFYSLIPRAMRVISARRRNIQSQIDVPLIEMSRQEYFDMPNKTASPSIPTQFYYDPQTTAGTLYLWPCPSVDTAAQYEIELTYLRRMDDIDASNDDLDIPQEWLEAVVYNLAQRLMFQYPVNDQGMASRIDQQAAMLFSNLSGWDNEPASIFLQPETRW